MKRIFRGTGTCVLIIIAFVLFAGCTFLNPGNAPVQSSSTPGVTSTSPVVQETTPAVAGVTTASPVVQETTPAAAGVTPTSTVAQTSTTVVAGVTTTAPVVQGTTPAVAGVPITTAISTLAQPTPEVVIPQTCAVIGGVICLADETCSGSMVNTTDSSMCCAGTCIVPSYAVTPIPTTSAAGVVTTVPQTCAAIGGVICQANQTCTGGIIPTTDTSQCCAGTCS